MPSRKTRIRPAVGRPTSASGDNPGISSPRLRGRRRGSRGDGAGSRDPGARRGRRRIQGGEPASLRAGPGCLLFLFGLSRERPNFASNFLGSIGSVLLSPPLAVSFGEPRLSFARPLSLSIGHLRRSFQCLPFDGCHRLVRIDLSNCSARRFRKTKRLKIVFCLPHFRHCWGRACTKRARIASISRCSASKSFPVSCTSDTDGRDKAASMARRAT